MTTVFLGRQPILDRNRRTYGYEFLYRGGQHDAAFFSDPDEATRAVLERSMLEWGFGRVLGGRQGFINASETFLRSGLYQVLKPDTVVIELAASLELDDATLAELRTARAAGYRLALDGVTDVARIADMPVTSLVDVLKVDVARVDPAELELLVPDLRVLAPRAHLLAEKVEDHDVFERCQALGFQFFQGYFFAKPEVLSRRTRPVHRSAALALLAEVQRPDIDVPRLEELVSSDPTLAYRLLSLVNSSAFGLADTVDSVRRAIVLLGIDKVRHIAALLTLSASSADNEELVVLAATRARMAGELAAERALSGSAFMAGLLSVLDAIFDVPLADLLGELPLPEVVTEALLEGTGPIGEVLEAVRAFERADVVSIESLRPGGVDEMCSAFGSAAMWADALRLQLSSRT